MPDRHFMAAIDESKVEMDVNGTPCSINIKQRLDILQAGTRLLPVRVDDRDLDVALDDKVLLSVRLYESNGVVPSIASFTFPLEAGCLIVRVPADNILTLASDKGYEGLYVSAFPGSPPRTTSDPVHACTIVKTGEQYETDLDPDALEIYLTPTIIQQLFLSMPEPLAPDRAGGPEKMIDEELADDDTLASCPSWS